MNGTLYKIKELVNLNKINEAKKEISKLGPEFHNDGDYLFLRSKIFFFKRVVLFGCRHIINCFRV